MSDKATSSVNGLARLKDLRSAYDRHQQPNDPDFEKKLPHVYSVLSDVRVSEKSMIEPPILILKNLGGQWSLTLIVGGLGMSGEVLGNTMAEALAELDRQLVANPKFWRVNAKRKVKLREIPKTEKSS
jgi:hypothetical protein